MDENEQINLGGSSPIVELQNFKNINNSLIQDALNVWDDLWAELDGQQNGSDNSQKTYLRDGFEPSCGWTQFLQKMWTLRNHLDFAKRLNQQ